ncbi:MAG: GDP-mannose 4,6-dehydratase [Candidatus Andersenbacteria bacterium]
MSFKVTQLPEDIRAVFVGKKVLITGGLGFIGSNLAHALVDLGAQVTLLDALLPLYGGNQFNVEEIAHRVTIIEGDIRDEALVKKTAKGQDVIYHLAAQVSYIDSKDQPFLDLDINGRGHLNVLEAVRTEAPQARVLFSSSRMVYGKILHIPVREDHPTEPLSLYGIHKLLGEKYGRYFADTFGIHTTAVRIPNPYGPRQQMKHSKYSIVGWFVREAMTGNSITIFGEGEQERDYLYIDDIVEAFLRLTVRGGAGEVYNIGTHERVRFVDMVEAVLRAVGSGQAKHVPWPEHYEKNETGNYIADTTKIFELTGWQPRVSLQAGIKEMVAYYRQHHQHYW